MNRQATITVRRTGMYIASYSRNTAGFFVVNGWHQALDLESSSAAQLGKAVLQALKASSEGVPVPPSYPSPEMREILAVAGVRSEREFARSSRIVKVTWDDSVAVLVVGPCRNVGGANLLPIVELSADVDMSGGDVELRLGQAVAAAAKQAG